MFVLIRHVIYSNKYYINNNYYDKKSNQMVSKISMTILSHIYTIKSKNKT